MQLAAALVHEPELLVLDEPFSGLDPVGVDVLSERAARSYAARGRAGLFSSHQLELVERPLRGGRDHQPTAGSSRRAGRGAARRGAAERRRCASRRRRRATAGSGRARGAEVARGGDGAALLVGLDDGADPARVLDAARAAGPVTHFASSAPTLAELFREAVAA